MQTTPIPNICPRHTLIHANHTHTQCMLTSHIIHANHTHTQDSHKADGTCPGPCWLLECDRCSLTCQSVDSPRQATLLLVAAALNWYRANVRLDQFGDTQPRPAPLLECPVLGVWSTGDFGVLEAQMKGSERYAQLTTHSCQQAIHLHHVTL